MVGSLAALPPSFVASCSLLPLPDDSTQVIASKLCRKCPCFAILHDPWLPVSSNAGNETMIPSFGSPRASFAGLPSTILPVDGVGWWYVGPDALEDVIISSKEGRRVQ